MNRGGENTVWRFKGLEKWRTWDQVQRTGCAPMETVAAGQISVTPNSSLLQGAQGRGKRSTGREELTVEVTEGTQALRCIDPLWSSTARDSRRFQNTDRKEETDSLKSKYATNIAPPRPQPTNISGCKYPRDCFHWRCKFSH